MWDLIRVSSSRILYLTEDDRMYDTVSSVRFLVLELQWLARFRTIRSPRRILQRSLYQIPHPLEGRVQRWAGGDLSKWLIQYLANLSDPNFYLPISHPNFHVCVGLLVRTHTLLLNDQLLRFPNLIRVYLPVFFIYIRFG